MELGKSIKNPVWCSVNNSIYNSVSNTVSDLISDSLWDSVNKSLTNSVIISVNQDHLLSLPPLYFYPVILPECQFLMHLLYAAEYHQ